MQFVNERSRSGGYHYFRTAAARPIRTSACASLRRGCALGGGAQASANSDARYTARLALLIPFVG